MNISLKNIYEEDLRDRSNINWDNGDEVKRISEWDKKRIHQVNSVLESNKELSGIDYHHASWIFQHGDEPSDYKKANELAKIAMEMGEERSKWLYAASFDRWMLSTNSPQKFGTQFLQNKSGDWELAQPIDKNTTDEERAKYNVPPISKALAEYKKK